MPDTIKLKVVSVRPLTPAIAEIVLGSTDENALPAYSAGAHLKFATPAGERSYSLVCLQPGDGFDNPERYRIAVQLEPDSQGGSRYMHSLVPGDIVEAAGPVNDFVLAEASPALLIAGGIGVTPVISMAAALTEAGVAHRFHYSARSRALMAFQPELAERFGGQSSMHFDDEPATALDLASLVGSLAGGEHLYVCGPKGMIEAAKSLAEAAGVEAGRIHYELFATPSPEAGDSSFEVVIHSTGETFEVPAGKTIIEVLEAGGVDIVYDCQRGDCGICQTGIIEGEADHRDVVLSDSEKAEGKVMQICVSRSKSPRLVLDL